MINICGSSKINISGNTRGVKMKIYEDIIQFIDYLLNSISNGKYLFYQINYVPENKVTDKEFLAKLDAKMENKYNTNLNKYQRLNLRRKDEARHLYVRYKNIIILLRTPGATEVANNENWTDIRNAKIKLKISDSTTYLIGLGQTKASKNKTLESRITVTLGKETYELIKLSCLDAIRYKKSIKKLYYEFNKINGFNGWSGINKQKIQLRDYLVKEVCKEFGIKKKDAKKIFRINTYRAKAQKDFNTACENQATDTMPVAAPT